MSRPNVPASGIYWVLVPVPVPGDALSLHYRAVATCSHAETEHYVVVATLERLRRTMGDLWIVHTRQTCCDCRTVEYVIKEGEDAPSK